LNRALGFDDVEITLSVLNLLKSASNFKDIISNNMIVEKLNLLLMTVRDLRLKFLIREILNKDRD